MTEPDEDAVVELNEQAAELVDAYRMARDAAQQWDDKRKDIAAQLASLLGPARKGAINGQHVVTRIPPTVRERFDTHRFKAAMPDLFNEFCVPTHVSGSIRLVGK